MTCPHCQIQPKFIATNAANFDPTGFYPYLCESCARISILVVATKTLREMTDSEMEAMRNSPAWENILRPARDLILERKMKEPPVDRSQVELSNGSPVTEDHTEINPSTGQQKGYIVLSAEERAKGFVRPLRLGYIHKTCGVQTNMARSIAETYARDPKFYSGTFCVQCKAHFPLDQFIWADGSRQIVGS